MEVMSFGKAIKSVTIVETTEAGDRVNRVVYSDRPKRKKQSKLLRPAEDMTRRMTEASIAGMQSYIDRHKRSNRKKRDGWLKEYRRNLTKAQRRAWRTFRDDD